MTDYIINEIKKIKKKPCIVAIDGRCGAGKTTLALNLKKHFGCSVVHMDDFFLRPFQRTEERLNEAGGNIDYERFMEEVVIPLKMKQSFCYKPFNCCTLDYDKEKTVDISDIVIIEGAYSCHPKFADIYDLKIFLDVSREEQLRRIEKRNGKAQAEQFVNKWIPLEETYFNTFKIKEKCDICF